MTLGTGHRHEEDIVTKAEYNVHTHQYVKMYTGSYVGNGANNRQITGFGFDPKFVIVTSDYGSYMYAHAIHDTMAAWQSYYFNSAAFDNNALEIITDGIEVNNSHGGDQCNANGKTYHIVAWGYE